MGIINTHSGGHMNVTTSIDSANTIWLHLENHKMRLTTREFETLLDSIGTVSSALHWENSSNFFINPGESNEIE